MEVIARLPLSSLRQRFNYNPPEEEELTLIKIDETGYLASRHDVVKSHHCELKSDDIRKTMTLESIAANHNSGSVISIRAREALRYRGRMKACDRLSVLEPAY